MHRFGRFSRLSKEAAEKSGCELESGRAEFKKLRKIRGLKQKPGSARVPLVPNGQICLFAASAGANESAPPQLPSVACTFLASSIGTSGTRALPGFCSKLSFFVS